MRNFDFFRCGRTLLCLLGLNALVMIGHEASLDAKEARPNVILLMTDDQGYGDFGFTGNPIIRTPHLDRMASESTSLEHFYVSPVCAPTRASAMTGRYSYRTRAIDTWNGHAMMDTDETTVAEVLKDSGYATGLFGKWHLGDNYPMRPQDQGFEEVLMHRGGGIGQPSDPDGGEGAYTNPILFHNGEKKRMKGFCTDIYFDEAMSWMDDMEEKNRPFFAYIATNAPHTPLHDVPEDLYQEYKAMDLANARFPQEKGHALQGKEKLDDRARIYAMITNIDDNVGKLFKHLESSDLGKNTIVIFLTDNGPNGNRYVSGFKGRKTMVTQGGIRSPALFHFPGRLEAGRSVEELSAHIDLAPTILEVCGTSEETRSGMDGRSLWPLLQGKKVDWADRSIVLQSHRGTKPVLFNNFSLVTQRWKLMNASGFQQKELPGEPAFELYDLGKDPYATQNVVGEYPEVLAGLKRDYVQWFADVSNTRPDNYAAPRIYIDPAIENPVILTRQDGEHFKGGPFGRDSLGVWKLEVIKPGAYDVRFRFASLKVNGEAILDLNGQKHTKAASKGTSELVFKAVPLSEGSLDLLPMLSVGGDLYSPWKIDVGQ